MTSKPNWACVVCGMYSSQVFCKAFMGAALFFGILTMLQADEPVIALLELFPLSKRRLSLSVIQIDCVLMPLKKAFGTKPVEMPIG